MTILLYLHILTTLFTGFRSEDQSRGICNVYGRIYIETVSRNRADLTVYVNTEDTFSDLKVFLHENQFYADKPGNWFIVKEREFADYIIYIEKEKNLAKYNIYFTQNEFEAGCP